MNKNVINSGVRFSTINSNYLSPLKELLYLRNKTIPEYVEWKYGPQSPNGFRGIIAFDNNRPIGCFGNIPLKCIDQFNNLVEVGWFADWYVLPEYRNKGIGLSLLNELTKHTPLLFGHPGPKKAVNLCLNAGWKNIFCQSKIIWIFDELNYYRNRSSNLAKALIKITKEKFQRIIQLSTHKYGLYVNKKIDNVIEILFENSFFSWILNQPTIANSNRSYGLWEKNRFQINYFDQTLHRTSEKYRRIIYIDPLNKIDKKTLKEFLIKSKLEKIKYVELLSGSSEFANDCLKLNGLVINESPIVYTGFIGSLIIHNLQGLYRENWLFQANYE